MTTLLFSELLLSEHSILRYNLINKNSKTHHIQRKQKKKQANIKKEKKPSKIIFYLRLQAKVKFMNSEVALSKTPSQILN